MKTCHPGIYDAFKTVATHNQWEDKKTVFFDFMNGYDSKSQSNGAGKLFTLHNTEGANGVHRAHFLDEMVKLVPEGVAHFAKHLDRIEGNDDVNGERPLTLHFHDGTTAQADAVVGTDGIKSRVRQIILGQDNPAAHAHYTHKYAYRGLIPIQKAIDTLGEDNAVNAKLYTGQNGHVLTFPINHGETMNVVAFYTNSKDWPDSQKLTLPTHREHALRDFKDFGPKVMSILNLLEDDLDRWAIFDMNDHPARTYTKGRVCISGDAAHATSPHHGSGAGFAIEDSAVLAELLASPGVDSPVSLPKAFEVFDRSRRERTEWLVDSSRRCGDLYEWRAEGVGKDIPKIKKELEERYERIWEGDIEQMVRDAKQMLQKTLGEQ